jgi:flagellar hook-length control protein FliK
VIQISLLNSITVPIVGVASKSGDANTSDLLGQGNPLFSSLLMSMTEDATAEPSEEHDDSPSLLEMVSSVIDDLEELQQESKSPEEQKIMYEVIQLLGLHGKQIEEEIKQGTAISTADKKDQRTTESISRIEMKLAELIRQLGQDLQGQKTEQVTEDTRLFAAPLSIKGVEAQKISEDLPKIVQLVKKVETMLNEFRQQPTIEQAEKPLFMMRSEQSPGRPALELPSLGGSASVTESVPTENQVETRLVPLAVESVKAGLLLQRTEPAASPPTIRMSHLAEELGEVMRNSMRLTSSGEATQIRVNIFPEHLGHLDIRLTEINGRISAQIFTGSMATKEALDMQVNHMRQTLLQQGIIIDKIEITQPTSHQSMGQQQAQADQRFAQHQRKGNSARDSNAYTGAEEETAAIRSQAPGGLMTVDYTV